MQLVAVIKSLWRKATSEDKSVFDIYGYSPINKLPQPPLPTGGVSSSQKERFIFFVHWDRR